jgi:hypothetical protein
MLYVFLKLRIKDLESRVYAGMFGGSCSVFLLLTHPSFFDLENRAWPTLVLVSILNLSVWFIWKFRGKELTEFETGDPTWPLIQRD